MCASKIFVLCLIFVSVHAIDYCGDMKCEMLPHSGCGKTPNYWAPGCVNPKLVPLTDELKKLILDIHNGYRNDIALGNVAKYEPAKAMATMTWSHDLAKTAEFHSRDCIYGHDKCRNTKHFIRANQNIGIQPYNDGDTPDNKKDVEGISRAWYEMEVENANMDLIRKFKFPQPFDPNAPVFGHFTQVITWDAYAIGCSMLTYTNTNAFDPPSLSNQLICNYSIGNLDENPIYNPGPTASDCKTGTNPKYPGLCSENEKYEAWYYV